MNITVRVRHDSVSDSVYISEIPWDKIESFVAFINKYGMYINGELYYNPTIQFVCTESDCFCELIFGGE